MAKSAIFGEPGLLEPCMPIAYISWEAPKMMGRLITPLSIHLPRPFIPRSLSLPHRRPTTTPRRPHPILASSNAIQDRWVVGPTSSGIDLMMVIWASHPFYNRPRALAIAPPLPRSTAASGSKPRSCWVRRWRQSEPYQLQR